MKLIKETCPVKYSGGIILPKTKLFNRVNFLLEEKYRGKPNIQFKKDIERLKKGEPLDYIIGFTEFLGCRIDLSKRTLIPRVETEFWVGEAIEKIINEKPFAVAQGKIINPLIILDMFSGSGCIGIAILKHVKNSYVVFTDSKKNALDQIKINCKLNNVKSNRHEIIQSDVFGNINGKFDYIFANPPYIAAARKNKIQKSVLKYEPKDALFGGKDGMLYIKEFLAKVPAFVKPLGKMYMEFDSIQKKQIEKLLKKYNYLDFKFHKDQYGKWRYMMISS